jgi:hypothetical protein
VFPSSHQAFVDNFGGIVPSCVDVYALLYHGIAARPKCFARLISAGLDLGLSLRRLCAGAAVCGHFVFSSKGKARARLSWRGSVRVEGYRSDG